MKSFAIKFIALSAFLAFVGCSREKLNVEPQQSISSDLALSSRGNVNSAVNSVYAGLKSTALYGRDMLAVADALSDITRATNRSGRLVPENNNALRSHMANWATAYGVINEINLILDAIPNVKDASATDRDSWEGQMKFVRGLLFFDLVKSYSYIPTAVIASTNKGGIPIKITPTTGSNASAYVPEREPIDKVYDQIYSDLNTAIDKLGNSLGVAYANRAAARALMSRVALYRGDYQTCITQSTSALSEGVGTLMTAANYVAGWRAAVNPESMFEVRFATAAENIGVNTSLQTSFTSLVTPGSPCTLGGFGDLVPSAFLLTQLGITTGAAPACSGTPPSLNAGTGVITRSTTDVRALLYEWGAVGRGTPNVECTKFLGKSGQINLDNVPVIRLSEMYLNRAEAAYKTGTGEAQALQDLNTIRVARGLATVTLTGTALRDEILRQRMLEFAFEGHRFFDLKRNGMDIVKSPANVPFNDPRILAPIPTAETDGNPKVPQNPGY